jgi:hypothetical protein
LICSTFCGSSFFVAFGLTDWLGLVCAIVGAALADAAADAAGVVLAAVTGVVLAEGAGVLLAVAAAGLEVAFDFGVGLALATGVVFSVAGVVEAAADGAFLSFRLSFDLIFLSDGVTLAAG